MISAELSCLLRLTSPDFPRTPLDGLDCGRLVNLAVSHGLVLRMVPLLGALPARVSEWLKAEALRAAAADLCQRATLSSILQAFSDEKIPVVTFKGPVLADQLYPGGNTRVCNDLDLLVRPEHVSRSIGVLRRFDYRPQIVAANPPSNPVLRLGGETLLRSQSTRTPVDLHWKLLGWSAPCPRRLTNPWHRLEPANWRGHDILSLPATELAAYLCYHGSKHMWLQLKYLYDLARLLESGTAIDWELLLQDARLKGESRFMLLGPYLAHRLLGAPLPPGWIQDCERDRALLEVASFVVAALEAPEAWEQHLRNRAVRARLIGNPGAVLRHFCLEALGPSAADWQSIQLPESLSFLYYPYRPLRLAGLRLRGLWSGAERTSHRQGSSDL